MKDKVIFFAVFSGVILFNSCGSRTSGNKQVFHYNETTGIATLDPAFAKNQSIIWAVHQLYNTLVETNEALQIVPSLATRWEVSADRRFIRFIYGPMYSFTITTLSLAARAGH
jgi:peptide/nickel transport system substrate-binding protein